MKEHEFKCKKCGNTWYATDKDIRESRKQQSNIATPNLHLETVKLKTFIISVSFFKEIFLPVWNQVSLLTLFCTFKV